MSVNAVTSFESNILTALWAKELHMRAPGLGERRHGSAMAWAETLTSDSKALVYYFHLGTRDVGRARQAKRQPRHLAPCPPLRGRACSRPRGER
jgi:hypothetical protein